MVVKLSMRQLYQVLTMMYTVNVTNVCWEVRHFNCSSFLLLCFSWSLLKSAIMGTVLIHGT